MNTVANSATDILIVGAGPAGLMMACQLADNDISFRIIDKNEDHTTQSRALVVPARSMEIFDQMGIATEALRRGQTARAIGAFFNGKRMLRVDVDHIGEGLTKFPYFFMLEQSQTEDLMIEFLKGKGYEVERRTELVSIRQDQHDVISILKLPDGNEEMLATRYAVAADGAHSSVREQLGIRFGGRTYEQSLFVLDCMAEVDLPHDEMYLTFSDKAVGGFFPLTNGRWRILGNIPEEFEGKESITFEDIEKNFAERIRMRVKLYDPHWISTYRSHHRYASTFQSGRCFLIGDAAHIHSPVGAQGMNTGLQDAYNLAWKISLVTKGIAKETLLKTFTEERIRIARTLVMTTDRAFKVVTSKNRFVTATRLYVAPLILKLVVPVLQKIKFFPRLVFRTASEIGIHYRTSSLSREASLGKFYGDAPRPGDRLPFVKFQDEYGKEINIQDKVHYGSFTFLIFSATVAKEAVAFFEPFKSFVSLQRIPLTARTRILYREFGVRQNGYYLVRPDMYIGYRADVFEREHLTRYLSRFVVDRKLNDT